MIPESASFFIQFCLQCGCFYFLSSRQLWCEHCFSIIQYLKAPPPKLLLPDHPNSYVYSHFTWSNQTQDVLYPALRLLKKVQSFSEASPFVFSVEKWFDHIPSEFFQNKKSLLWIPVPSEINPKRSFFLAAHLQSLLGGEILDILQKEQLLQVSLPQKRKSAEERTHITLTLKKELLSKIQDHNLVIFVDDIVTTGSTLKACQKALSLDYLVAWTFAYRPKRANQCNA
jgi:predicted amidophosphoribosyltransferase